MSISHIIEQPGEGGEGIRDVPPQRSTSRKLKEWFIPFLLSSCQSRSTLPVFSFGPFSTSKAQSEVSLAEDYQRVRGLKDMSNEGKA